MRSKLIDSHGRVASYLRLSLTDRCNFRCQYCMPEQGIQYVPKSNLLTYEELLKLAKIFVDLGVSKIRLTGGEPLLRKGVDQFVEKLHEILPNLYLTTNGSLIHLFSDAFFQQFKGINLSLDSLSASTFSSITRRNDFDQTLENLHHLCSLSVPLSLNMVVMKGVNDHEIIDFIHFGKANNCKVRFIEAMPFNECDGNKNHFIPIHQIEHTIRASFPQVRKNNSTKSKSSVSYSVNHYDFDIIPAYSRSLCQFCNRVRLNHMGKMMTCLYASDGLDLRSLLRSNASEIEIKDAILSANYLKEESGFEEENQLEGIALPSMSKIGG